MRSLCTAPVVKGAGGRGASRPALGLDPSTRSGQAREGARPHTNGRPSLR